MPLEKRLIGKRVAIFAEDLYEDLELWYPLLRLQEEGAEVLVVGPGGATYRDAAVVVDGNLITSRQPGDQPAFLGAIIAGLEGEMRCPACQKVLYGGQPWD